MRGPKIRPKIRGTMHGSSGRSSSTRPSVRPGGHQGRATPARLASQPRPLPRHAVKQLVPSSAAWPWSCIPLAAVRPARAQNPALARPANPSHHGVWLDVLCNHCAARHGGALAHRHAWQDDAAACRGRVLCRERLALHVHAQALLSRPARHARLSHGVGLLAKPPRAGHAGKEPRPSLSGRRRQAEILDPGSSHLPARRRCRSMRSAQSRRAQAGAV